MNKKVICFLAILALLSSVSITFLSLSKAYSEQWTGGDDAIGVNEAKTSWYFAEGCTRNGFNTWLCLYNPNGTSAGVWIIYFLENGERRNCGLTLAPYSRGTVDVGATCKGEHDVSTSVNSTHPITAERSVYFNHDGYEGGHCTPGVPSPSKIWYFAEGCSQPGFQEWLCILNPYGSIATVLVTYYIEDQGTTGQTVQVPANTRYTQNVNEVVGSGKNVSMKVESLSGNGIICERPMYFIYKGAWPGGHDTAGATALSKTWYFAEGCTGENFETWLCLQNANATPTNVTATYMVEGSDNTEKVYEVPGNSRKTVEVAKEIGTGENVSIKVSSDADIMAERPMYFNYHGVWPDGSDSLGSPSPQKQWLFAEGCTRPGFETWLCIQNPNSYDVTAGIEYALETGQTVGNSMTVGANKRLTVSVNQDVGAGHDTSIKVVSPTEGIICERPMYFSYEGKPPVPEEQPAPAPPDQFNSDDYPTTTGLELKYYTVDPYNFIYNRRYPISFTLEGPWDFSTGPTEGERSRKYVPVSSVPESVYFPGATIARRQNDGVTNTVYFYTKDASTYYIAGMSLQDTTMNDILIRNYQPSDLIYKFPFKVGDSWVSQVNFNDSHYQNYSGTEVTYTRIISKNSIKVPQGNYQNCYMVQSKTQRSFSDGTSYNWIEYTWLVPGVGSVVYVSSANGEINDVFTQAESIERLKEVK